MAKVVIYSPHPIKESMAGSAIRAWEFAKALSTDHQVILISPEKVVKKSEGFECVSFKECKEHFQNADVLVTQRLTISLALLASAHGTRIIIDAYDPSPLELLEYYRKNRVADPHKRIASEISTLSFSFKMADGILCASERQRALWIGFLLAQKLIPLNHYEQDPNLKKFLQVIPFGIPSAQPKKNGKGIREKFNFQAEDKVILWGGGIWNWFDPLTLIQAMKRMSHIRPEIKLVFMGVKPPDPSLPAMAMASEAIQLADQLELINRTVFFHQEWIPYDERHNFLLDADLGISTHFEHLETHFSFRTRLLDYLWAQLPLVTTEGDVFAEWVEKYQLGAVVPYRNEQALAEAIMNLLDDSTRLLQIKKSMINLRENFYWESVIDPLRDMVRHLTSLSRNRYKWKTKKSIFAFCLEKLIQNGVKACFQKALQNR